jgi:hypothetical protein
MKKPTRRAKGHWPKGKRRNDREGVAGLIVRTKRLLGRRAAPGKVSLRALAAAMGVDARSVSRWLAGEDVPSGPRKAAWQRCLDRQEA